MAILDMYRLSERDHSETYPKSNVTPRYQLRYLGVYIDD